MDEELERRRQLTFLQAEGLAPLPSQLAPRRVTKRLRITLLEILELSFLEEVKRARSHACFKSLWMFHFERFGSDFPEYWSQLEKFFRNFLEAANDPEVLDFMQALSRQTFITTPAFLALQRSLEREHIAHRLVGTPGSEDNRPTLLPISFLEQAQTTEENWSLIVERGGKGAAEHLRRAAACLSAGTYNDAVRESIHAVESAAKTASGNSSATLTDALKQLERSKPLHGALKQALIKLYGWTSDAQGIRHALIDPKEEIPEEMALFMFSACTAFASWLLAPAHRA